VFADPLPSNRRPIFVRVGCRGNVSTESLPNNRSIRHNIQCSIVYKYDMVTVKMRVKFNA
jgi:hypothetical protein